MSPALGQPIATARACVTQGSGLRRLAPLQLGDGRRRDPGHVVQVLQRSSPGSPPLAQALPERHPVHLHPAPLPLHRRGLLSALRSVRLVLVHAAPPRRVVPDARHFLTSYLAAEQGAARERQQDIRA